MMKNQHRYDEISADLLQFDTLMFPYRNEKLTYVIIFQVVYTYVSRSTAFEGQCKPHHLGDAHPSSGGR